MIKNATSKIILGFEVEHKDFWEDTKEIIRICSNGHRPVTNIDNFCSICGSKVKDKQIKKLTERFKKYLQNKNSENFWPEDGLENLENKDKIFNFALNPNLLKNNISFTKKYNFGIYMGDRSNLGDKVERILIGINLSEINFIPMNKIEKIEENGDNITFLEELGHAIGSVKSLRNLLGLDFAEIGIYHTSLLDF